MTLKSSPPPLTRRAERATLRSGPPWRWPDVLLVLVMSTLLILALISPALLADIGDTVIGPTQINAELGASLSGLLLAAGRWGVAALVLYTLWQVREAPFSQRAAWSVIATGLLLNYARNVYTGAPATLSFLLAQAGLLWLLFRLSLRPTIWQQMQSWQARAEAAESELKRLRGGP